jgi:uncharacterized RDD family membrane protein YckC
MSINNRNRAASSSDFRQHAYDARAEPELFAGVVGRRFMAFLIDLIVLAVPVVLATILVFVFGIVTLGLGFALFGLFSPAVVIWTLCYYGFTLGSARSATLGMRALNLEMRTWYGAPCYFVLGAVHAVVFWVTVSMLTPLVLLVCLFNDRRRFLHDMLVGTVVINSDARARAIRL